MQYLVADMYSDMKAKNYGTAIQGIPFGVLKLIFAAIFLAIAIVQLNGIY